MDVRKLPTLCMDSLPCEERSYTFRFELPPDVSLFFVVDDGVCIARVAGAIQFHAHRHERGHEH